MSLQLISANHASAAAVTLAARANRKARVLRRRLSDHAADRVHRAALRAGDREGRVVRVESEHSAMGVCIGGSLAGARSFTASSSNGLAYMAENVFAAASTGSRSS